MNDIQQNRAALMQGEATKLHTVATPEKCRAANINQPDINKTMKKEFISLTDEEAMQTAMESAEKCAVLFSTSLQTLADYAAQRMRNKPETRAILDGITKVAPSLPNLLRSLASIDAKIRKTFKEP